MLSQTSRRVLLWEASLDLYSHELVRELTIKCDDRVIAAAVVKLSGIGLDRDLDYFEERFSKLCDLIDTEVATTPNLGAHEGKDELQLGRFIHIDAGKDAEVLVHCNVVATNLPEPVALEVIAMILQSFSTAVMIELIGLEEHIALISDMKDLSGID